MRSLLLVCWVLAAIGGILFHLGPGQGLAATDQLSSMLDHAYHDALAGDHQEAFELYDQVLQALPPEEPLTVARVRLEKAKVLLESGSIAQAHLELSELNHIIDVEKDVPVPFRYEVQSALAATEFYGTWAMRLEGVPKDSWLPFVESARQRFRYLSEVPDSEAVRPAPLLDRQNLEVTIRLERMTEDELQGMPLPPPVQFALFGSKTGAIPGVNGMAGPTDKATGRGENDMPGDARNGMGAGNGTQVERTGS